MKQIILSNNQLNFKAFLTNEQSYWSVNSFIFTQATKFGTQDQYEAVESLCCRLDFTEEVLLTELLKTEFVGNYFIVDMKDFGIE